jgi:hypothetical protein
MSLCWKLLTLCTWQSRLLRGRYTASTSATCLCKRQAARQTNYSPLTVIEFLIPERRPRKGPKMGYREKNMLIASCLLLLCFVLVIIAFSTPCWLENDGQLPDATFQRIGMHWAWSPGPKTARNKWFLISPTLNCIYLFQGCGRCASRILRSRITGMTRSSLAAGGCLRKNTILFMTSCCQV